MFARRIADEPRPSVGEAVDLVCEGDAPAFLRLLLGEADDADGYKVTMQWWLEESEHQDRGVWIYDWKATIAYDPNAPHTPASIRQAAALYMTSLRVAATSIETRNRFVAWLEQEARRAEAERRYWGGGLCLFTLAELPRSLSNRVPADSVLHDSVFCLADPQAQVVDWMESDLPDFTPDEQTRRYANEIMKEVLLDGMARQVGPFRHWRALMKLRRPPEQAVFVPAGAVHAWRDGVCLPGLMPVSAVFRR